MNVDLTKNGLESVFTPWQIETLKVLAEGGIHTSFTLSGEVNKRLRDGGVSRASVIGFMKELEVWDFVTVETDVKRGGKYRIYKFGLSSGQTLERVIELVQNWVNVARASLSSTKTVKTEAI